MIAGADAGSAQLLHPAAGRLHWLQVFSAPSAGPSSADAYVERSGIR
jgi:hypothetical protein